MLAIDDARTLRLRILSATSVRLLALAVIICALAMIPQSQVTAAPPPGTVYGWGDNIFGKIATGSGFQQLIPTVTGFADYGVSVATSGGLHGITGGGHSLVVKTDGSVWATGLNTCPFQGHNPIVSGGQLGDGTLTNRATPVPVVGAGPGSGFIAVAAGICHSLGLKSDGTVWAWGTNQYGEIGDGSAGAPRLTPVQVKLFDVIAIDAGTDWSLALQKDGSVWAWGRNLEGELGNGTTLQAISPVRVRFSRGVQVIAISAGSIHGLALDNSGAVWSWGSNYRGQLGDGTQADQPLPQIVKNGGAVAVSAGGSHSLSLENDGSIWSWGANDEGQLGNGSTSSTPTLTPTVAFRSRVVAIAAGNAHNLALDFSGRILTWGANGRGQLGDGSTVRRPSPVFASMFYSSTHIAAGGDSSLALRF